VVEVKVKSFGNQHREKDRIIVEGDSEIKSLKDYNMKIKMDFEEELRRQIVTVKGEEKSKYESVIKGQELRIKDADVEIDSLKNKVQDLVHDVNNKDKMNKDVKGRVEDQVGALRRELIDLNDKISAYDVEVQRLHGELRGKDSAIGKVQNDTKNLDEEIRKQKDRYLQEIHRINVRNDNDLKRFQEYERQLKARCAELERLLKNSEEDASNMRMDFDRMRETIHGNLHHALAHTFVNYEA